ncbi:MAG TPA: tripartite tricarboxylate transporter substrate binding protein [Noviherbaspirillum sp.]|nr:tripartite tricarboxylate transporter substrate binding protein [Noviherbaspirillum sp.]
MKALLVRLAVVMVAMWGAMAPAQAQGSKVTRIVVGFPPGQATDLVARLIAERLTVSLGHSVIVENKPGQGGSIALAQLAKSPADGSVLSLSALAAYVVNPYLYPTVRYDSVKDLAPIGMVAELPMLLVVHPSVPAHTLPELIAYAKANPEALAHSSSGNGTLSHLMMEDLKRRAGITILHTPYQGSAPAMTDLVAGRVQVGLDTIAATQSFVKDGKLRLIAAGTPRRLAAFPEAPTVAEQGFEGFEAAAWIALSAPAGTPLEVRTKINDAVVAALNTPEFQERLAALGAVPRPGTVEEFSAYLRSEQQRWKSIVERSGARVD